VAHLRGAGAVIVGRSNAPAFSLRWFTDNDLHGRTLNPFDPSVTPGGSSGGAAAAVATGMGPIAHGNDYGGSIRHPAWACGVVGLRTTPGRVPSYKASAPNRVITNQMMSVQGPLTRNVRDARLALQVMSQGSPLDPQWTPAPLDHAAPNRPLRVAVFSRHAAYDIDASVVAAVEQAAQWLAAAGCEVTAVEPPHFEEGAQLWRQLVMDDMRRGGLPAVEALGDAGVRSALRGYLQRAGAAGCRRADGRAAAALRHLPRLGLAAGARRRRPRCAADAGELAAPVSDRRRYRRARARAPPAGRPKPAAGHGDDGAAGAGGAHRHRRRSAHRRADRGRALPRRTLPGGG
jgi:Asp-tRNA(Asn)/Glu-tRNA(Gln) amidotransferase A subunit family amidase